MQLIESSIYINLKRLRSEFYDAQFLMDKSVRIIYGSTIIKNLGKTLSYFVMAFTDEENRRELLKRCIGEFAIVRTDIEFVTDKRLIHYKKRKVENEKGELVKPADERDSISSKQVEMLKLVAVIDSDMCKWWASQARGKTIRA